MARTCDYYYFLEDGQKQKCVNKFELREILFKNPEYRDQDVECVLCNTHYLEVFGEWESKNQLLLKNYLNKKSKYFKDFGNAKKYAEYFNEYDYKTMNWYKVEDAKRQWDNHKYKTCCYEICDIKLSSVRRKLQIIIDKPNGMYDKKLRTCSKEHWLKFLYHIGVMEPPKMGVDAKRIITLDTFNGLTQDG